MQELNEKYECRIPKKRKPKIIVCEASEEEKTKEQMIELIIEHNSDLTKEDIEVSFPIISDKGFHWVFELEPRVLKKVWKKDYLKTDWKY